MRKGQDRKVKFAGRAGCVGLLALGLTLVNPVGMSAFAEEDYGIDTQEDIPSTVEISFSPAVGSASLSPTTPTGQSAQINVLARVSVKNSGGYSVYLKSDTQNLVGQKDSANVIPGATTAKTYNAMDVNTWGYYAGEGSSVPEGATYKAISVSGNGDKVAENSNSKIWADAKNIMLSFAAKINDEMPADTYQNTVTMSIVSSPLQTTLTDIANMQDMTSAICSASAMYETKQLKDVRDGKYYWVTKLADGRCWMTQNLDLDLANGAPLSSATSDLGWDGTKYPATAITWNPPYTTADTVSSSTILADDTGTRSWSLGDYRITNPDTPSSCGSGKASAADCTSQFSAYTTPTTANKDENAHYILGNHYQWNTATAGSGDEITSGVASDSICPRNWRLPTSNAGGEFDALVMALGGTSSTDNVTKPPFYGVRGGDVYRNSYLFANPGNFGVYWSSSPYSGGYSNYACNLAFNSDNDVNPFRANPRSYGFSVRCIAR